MAGVDKVDGPVAAAVGVVVGMGSLVSPTAADAEVEVVGPMSTPALEVNGLARAAPAVGAVADAVGVVRAATLPGGCGGAVVYAV